MTENTVRDRRSEAGFTLIEIFVVIVVIGVLVAIAVPTFLGTRDNANDASAQARATQALKAHATYHANLAEYASDADAAQKLKAVEPSLRFEPLPPSGSVPTVVQGIVYVRTSTNEATLVARSASGVCYWVRDRDGVKEYARGACEVDAVTFGDRW